MSISTTSGFAFGITRKASSPLAQAHTQRKPGASPISNSKLRRVPESSSTMATDIITVLGHLIDLRCDNDLQRATGENTSLIPSSLALYNFLMALNSIEPKIIIRSFTVPDYNFSYVVKAIYRYDRLLPRPDNAGAL